VMRRNHRHSSNGNQKKKKKKSQRYYEDIGGFVGEETKFLLDYDLECPCCRQVFVDRSLLLLSTVVVAGQRGADCGTVASGEGGDDDDDLV